MKRRLELNNIYLEVNIVKMNRKTMAIHLSEDDIVIVKAPKGISDKIVMDFVHSKKDWIYERYIRRQQEEATRIRFCQGSKIAFAGDYLSISLVVKESIRGKHLVKYNPISKELTIFSKNINLQEEELIREVVRRWYIQEARTAIEEKAKYYANIFGVTYEKISIKEQKSVWGSCSGKRNLNFNFKLIMMPEEILDYVVIHELAHLLEMNHSPRFWIRVESLCPNYRYYKDWLKVEGYKYKF